jgi:acetyl-CoA carboxylase biotin carboxyl carrier protein
MSETTLRSDITGRVWKLLKAEGDSVAADEPVMIVEAMKMEIPIALETAGQVKALLVKEGDEIEADQAVAVLETRA